MSKRVLVVEDQEDNMQIMNDMLASAGYQVIKLTRAIKLCFEEEGVELAHPWRHVVLEPNGARDEPPTGDRDSNSR